MKINEFGRKITEKKKRNLLEKIHMILLNKTNKLDVFLGSHPITLTKENLRDIYTQRFLVCEKTDGIRVLVICVYGSIYLYDRKISIYKTGYIYGPENLYVLDGELYEEDGKYIVSLFDTIIYKNKNISQQNLYQRLYWTENIADGKNEGNKYKDAVSKELIEKIEENTPRDSLKSIEYRKNIYTSFSIKAKKMHSYDEIGHVVNSLSSLKHECDGLIFTPIDPAYILLGKMSKIYKWKPPRLNTADFKVKAFDGKPGWYRLYGGGYLDKHRNPVDNEESLIFCGYYYGIDLKESIDGVIGEFFYSPKKKCVDPNEYFVKVGGWEFYKTRVDKQIPNSIKVIESVSMSIKENITESQLRDICKELKEIYQRTKSAL